MNNILAFKGLALLLVLFIRDLHRSGEDEMIFGVCGGLAVNCTIPSWVFRLIFIASVMTFGIGIFVYVAMAIQLPLKRIPKKDKTQKSIERLESLGFVALPRESVNGLNLSELLEKYNDHKV